uniref:Uncharacterized protein n=1 Tax=Periophthalmus magnuspinnatus TaxID=409849 RepID=A0A3B3ZUP9_9GOBI
MSAGSGGLQLASERYGSGGFWNYRLEGTEIRRQREGPGGHTGTGLRNLFKSVFLPQGFPESVSTDYLQYQLWDTAQAFCSSLSGTLATQASLRGVGVGNQEATVAAATATWILRDGTGMLGRILFAWRKGLFADVLNDIAMFMEILAQFFPTFFLLIICTAGVFKSIVGVAGGATRAALTVHQARRDNMADISAKDGSQVHKSPGLVQVQLTLLLFTLFTVLHLVSNFKAVRAVIMETFNETRLEVVWQNFVQNQEILTPREANEMEPVFSCELDPLLFSPGSVCVCLLLGASVRDEFKAMCHALSLRRLLSERHKDNIQGKFILCNLYRLVLAQSWFRPEVDLVYQKLVEKYFDPFMKSLAETQWETNRNLLDWDEWRIQIKCKSN